jgi:deoxyribodipyrimidine photo-lyase
MNKLRIHTLKSREHQGDYVLYWMQQSQRVHYNHALCHAIEHANQLDQPLVVFFGLTPSYPDANERHYHFMLEGLKEVKGILEHFGVNFVFKLESPNKGILPFLEHASLLVMDYGYLTFQKIWRKEVWDYAVEKGYSLGIDLVDTDLIVPVRVTSNKAEYGAYTLRPKIKKLYQNFRDFTHLPVLKNKQNLSFYSDDQLKHIDTLVESLPIDHSVKKSPIYRGGYIEANHLFIDFLQRKLNAYKDSNDPSLDLTSKLSMYLHFGQISPLEILDKLMLASSQGHVDGESLDAFIEQLLVRRELAFNYVTYHKGYDVFETMTESWAYQTMEDHKDDFHPYVYSRDELEHAQTHDPYYNAAMMEMSHTGYMHNYMRMYWAKKIIEWTPSFKIAYDTIKYLNNKYFIDGRDANSYTGIAWCFGKHDRPWTEREIFGKLRYMNAKGLERKFDIASYVNRMDTIVRKVK